MSAVVSALRGGAALQNSSKAANCSGPQGPPYALIPISIPGINCTLYLYYGNQDIKEGVTLVRMWVSLKSCPNVAFNKVNIISWLLNRRAQLSTCHLSRYPRCLLFLHYLLLCAELSMSFLHVQIGYNNIWVQFLFFT